MNNAQKTPYVKSLNAFAQRKALDEIEKRGQALPGRVVSVTGAIVTVAFQVTGATLPQVTMPVQGSKYIRLPIQPGDLGYALPADAYMGGVSGLGGGTADLTPRGNLSTLVWFPVGNKDWTSVPAGIVLDSESVTATGNLSVGNGASGVFTTPTGDTVTVQNGIIVNIA